MSSECSTNTPSFSSRIAELRASAKQRLEDIAVERMAHRHAIDELEKEEKDILKLFPDITDKKKRGPYKHRTRKPKAPANTPEPAAAPSESEDTSPIPLPF
jgi:hypothetical protein